MMQFLKTQAKKNGIFETTYIYGSNQWLTLQKAPDPGGFTSEVI